MTLFLQGRHRRLGVQMDRWQSREVTGHARRNTGEAGERHRGLSLGRDGGGLSKLDLLYSVFPPRRGQQSPSMQGLPFPWSRMAAQCRRDVLPVSQLSLIPGAVLSGLYIF